MAIAAALAVTAVGMTIAYFSSHISVQNNTNIGFVETEIVEDFDSEESVEPGKNIKKVVTVKNNDSSPCYVRVFCEFNKSSVNKWASLDYNTTTWTDVQPDGYRYYKSVLEAGDYTDPLITNISIDDDAVSISDFDVIVASEAVQAVNPENGDYYPNAQDAFTYFGKTANAG